MAGWWVASWIRADVTVALGRIDVSKNQFVRYSRPTNQEAADVDQENPLGGVFSDLPAISTVDTNTMRVHGREIQDLIKPSTRLIHYIFEKLKNLGPGQYILGHKRFDMNATLHKATEDEEQPDTKASKANQTTNPSPASRARYDLHAAHQSSPQFQSGSNTDGGNSGGGGGGSGAIGEYVDDELQLQWIGTPDQIPGTFPYDECEVQQNPPKRRGRPPKQKTKAAKTKAKATKAKAAAKQ